MYTEVLDTQISVTDTSTVSKDSIKIYINQPANKDFAVPIFIQYQGSLFKLNKLIKALKKEQREMGKEI